MKKVEIIKKEIEELKKKQIILKKRGLYFMSNESEQLEKRKL